MKQSPGAVTGFVFAVLTILTLAISAFVRWRRAARVQTQTDEEQAGIELRKIRKKVRFKSKQRQAIDNLVVRLNRVSPLHRIAAPIDLRRTRAGILTKRIEDKPDKKKKKKRHSCPPLKVRRCKSTSDIYSEPIPQTTVSPYGNLWIDMIQDLEEEAGQSLPSLGTDELRAMFRTMARDVDQAWYNMIQSRQQGIQNWDQGGTPLDRDWVRQLWLAWADDIRRADEEKICRMGQSG